MKIAICTVGSTGDIQPYLALALELRRAGHSIKVISHPFHRERFLRHGFEYVSCGPVVTQQDLNEMLDRMLSTRNPLKQLQMLMLEAFFADGEAYFRSSKAALMDCDLAICHMVDFLSSEAATQLGIPRIGGILAAAGIATAYAVPPRMPYLGRWLNPLVWKALDLAMAPIDHKAKRFLRQLGGPSVTPRRFHVLAPQLNLLACSPTLCRTFPDLPAHIQVTGPWILKDKESDPPADLTEFLKRHPNPVVVSFGSMGGTKGPQLTQVVLEALKLAGKPAVIQAGYSGMAAMNHPESVHFADFVAHEWLFPQAACVIHHAGAGTTMAVARAGVPHVPVTFIADQPYFASNICRLGIGTPWMWYHQMRPQNLARCIREACESPAMQHRARDLRPTFLAEEGNALAVRHIEDFIQKIRA